MSGFWNGHRILTEGLFFSLIRFYPSRFRSEFGQEILEIYQEVIREAETRGELPLLLASLHEGVGLVVSIVKENWREFRTKKEKTMVPEDYPTGSGSSTGAAGLTVVWVLGWAVLVTLALPVALAIAAPISAVLLLVVQLGHYVGIWPAVDNSILTIVAFVGGLSLLADMAQYTMIRKILPRPRSWFIATGVGLLAGGLVGSLALVAASRWNWDPFFIEVALLLAVGLVLGMSQWLVLRSLVPRAYLIILIDILAVASILTGGRPFTSYIELSIFFLPGLISGVGLWFLLRQEYPLISAQKNLPAKPGMRRWGRRLLWLGLGASVLVPLFFGFTYVYAISQIALAKNVGVYPTVEKAIISNNSQGWGGAKVVRIDNVHAGPNRWDGSQPEIWFGGATIYLDRVPKGYTRSTFTSGSYYVHVREGWVLMPEGAFPEFVGWAMELYGLEGVNHSP